MTSEQADRYMEAAQKTVAEGCEAMPKLLGMIEETYGEAEGATDEERRLTARAKLVAQHHFRSLLNTVQAGVFLATETGCVEGRDSADSYERASS